MVGYGGKNRGGEMKTMDKTHQELILAAEIGGFLHDLGKLLPEFAEETTGGKDKNLSDLAKTQACIYAAHGAILETGRVYPVADQLTAETNRVLARLLSDPIWRDKLAIPAAWCHENTIQAQGLGAPLRQHHANWENKGEHNFPDDELSLLGDIYSFGADIRDSALDKGSGKCKDGKQKQPNADICDGFGHRQQEYSPKILAENWQQAVASVNTLLGEPGQDVNVLKTRKRLYEQLKPMFKQALGETRRPTNDVTLFHHSFSAASHFKAAMAEGVLREDFKLWQDEKGLFDLGKLGLVRFRLLGIRWCWADLSRGVLRPVALASLSQARRQAEQNLQGLFEETYPIGNIIYRDDDGVLVLVPGFYEGDGECDQERSETWFKKQVIEPLLPDISLCLKDLGCGVDFSLHWSRPSLYLTDYPEALGINTDSKRQRFGQVGLDDLKALWQTAPHRHPGQQIAICPQCGLRPATTRELALTESTLGDQALCEVCQDFSNEWALKERRWNAEALFGIRPETFNLQAISQQRNGSENGRMVLVSVQVDAAAIASGEALITQLARPVAQLVANEALKWSANRLGDELEKLLSVLRDGDESKLKQVDSALFDKIGDWVGDEYWLKKNDGRSQHEDKLAKALDVAENFFLREAIPEGLGLCRHDGDRLALFAQRKHASPARLQRLWDDLEDEWRELVGEAAKECGLHLMPLSLDARGVRFIVAANDARDVLLMVQRRLLTHFSKVRGGLPVHVSALAFKAKFPLYIAMDAMYRLERRVSNLKTRWQTWVMRDCQVDTAKEHICINWQTPHGQVDWTVDINCGDPGKTDIWHPHVISTSRPEGPDRLVHVRQLQVGDEVAVPVSTFDFLTLEGSARRFDIVYDAQGRRPHFVLGHPGRPPHLLEQMPELLHPSTNWAAQTGWDSSRLKGLYGRLVETYEAWVRLAVNDELRESGLAAWRAHSQDLLGRHLSGKDNEALRQNLLAAITDGRFFDAVEWNTYIYRLKSTKSPNGWGNTHSGLTS